MSNYIIEDLIDSSLEDINEKGAILWVFHADKIPPHIGISFNGEFYSLKAKGKDEAVNVTSIKNIISKKRITTLSFELKDGVVSPDLDTYFKPFQKTIPYKVSCLDPIKAILGYNQAEKLTDMLALMSVNNDILVARGVNIENFKGIIDYEVTDIHLRLEKLNNAK